MSLGRAAGMARPAPARHSGRGNRNCPSGRSRRSCSELNWLMGKSSCGNSVDSATRMPLPTAVPRCSSNRSMAELRRRDRWWGFAPEGGGGEGDNADQHVPRLVLYICLGGGLGRLDARGIDVGGAHAARHVHRQHHGGARDGRLTSAEGRAMASNSKVKASKHQRRRHMPPPARARPRLFDQRQAGIANGCTALAAAEKIEIASHQQRHQQQKPEHRGHGKEIAGISPPRRDQGMWASALMPTCARDCLRMSAKRSMASRHHPRWKAPPHPRRPFRRAPRSVSSRSAARRGEALPEASCHGCRQKAARRFPRPGRSEAKIGQAGLQWIGQPHRDHVMAAERAPAAFPSPAH